MVPEHFGFPKVDLETGFRLCLIGLLDHTNTGANGEIYKPPIPPF